MLGFKPKSSRKSRQAGRSRKNINGLKVARPAFVMPGIFVIHWAMTKDHGAPEAERSAQKRERALVARFQARLAHVVDNFRNCRAVMNGRRSYNQTIGDLRTACRPRAKRAPRTRLDPQIEFLIAWKLNKQGINDPKPEDVGRICAKLARTLKPTRGRPDDHILSHHVEALAVLFEETCGSPISYSRTLNSIYQPRLSEPAGSALVQIIQSVDPGVTETAIVNIIAALPKPGDPSRKRFRHYFPLADHVGAMPDEIPGHDARSIGVIWPIYCS